MLQSDWSLLSFHDEGVIFKNPSQRAKHLPMLLEQRTLLHYCTLGEPKYGMLACEGLIEFKSTEVK